MLPQANFIVCECLRFFLVNVMMMIIIIIIIIIILTIILIQ